MKFISYIYEKAEKFICSKLDCIIAATPFIRDIFQNYNINAVNVNNYPILQEGDFKRSLNFSNQISYVGRITTYRGCNEIVEAMQYVNNDIKLCLAGLFDKSIDMDNLKGKKGWEKIDYKGFLNQEEIKSLLNTSFAGIVTIYPTANYLDSLPSDYKTLALSNYNVYKKIKK